MSAAVVAVRRTAVICRIGRHLGFQWRLGAQAGFWMTTRRDTEERLRDMGATHIEEVDVLETSAAAASDGTMGPWWVGPTAR